MRLEHKWHEAPTLLERYSVKRAMNDERTNERTDEQTNHGHNGSPPTRTSPNDHPEVQLQLLRFGTN